MVSAQGNDREKITINKQSVYYYRNKRSLIVQDIFYGLKLNQFRREYFSVVQHEFGHA